MICALDVPPFLDAMHELALRAAARVRERLEPRLEIRKVAAGEDLLRLLDDGYVFIAEGWFKYQREGRLLRIYAAGDLVHARSGDGADGATLVSEFPGECATIVKEELLAALAADPALMRDWLLWQETETRILAALATLFMGEDVRPEFVMKRFAPGETILREGEEPDAIYLLLEGQAEARVDGVEVGRIAATEAFGEISFLTGHPRVASVVASSPCLAQRIDKGDFLRLMRAKPQFILGLAKTLAGRVIKLNTRVAGGTII